MQTLFVPTRDRGRVRSGRQRAVLRLRCIAGSLAEVSQMTRVGRQIRGGIFDAADEVARDVEKRSTAHLSRFVEILLQGFSRQGAPLHTAASDSRGEFPIKRPRYSERKDFHDISRVVPSRQMWLIHGRVATLGIGTARPPKIRWAVDEPAVAHCCALAPSSRNACRANSGVNEATSVHLRIAMVKSGV